MIYFMIQYKGRMVGFPNDFNFIQQKSPTSIGGEMNASFYQFSGSLNPG